MVEPDTAFWALCAARAVGRSGLGRRSAPRLPPHGRPIRRRDAECASGSRLGRLFQPHRAVQPQLHLLLHPREMRRGGRHMSRDRLLRGPGNPEGLFRRAFPPDTLPQIVFHGAEPLLNRDAVFAGIAQYRRRFPLRRADQRHAAGRRGDRLPAPARSEHGHFAGCRRGGHRRPHPHDLARQGVFGQVIEAMERLGATRHGA